MAIPQASGDWFPNRLAEQAEMFQNIKNKIGGYTAILPITAGQTTAIVALCNEFSIVYNYVLQARATTEALVEWRDIIFRGSPVGGAAPAPPTYPVYSPLVGSTIGIFTAFRDLIEIIKAAPGYTRAIGEDLMIVAVKPESLAPGEVTPDLKIKSAGGSSLQISGSLQGLDAMRVEYIKDGTSIWHIAAFLTNLPAEITIPLTTPGQPETGRIRAVLIKKNEEFGNFSPEYPVTLS